MACEVVASTRSTDGGISPEEVSGVCIGTSRFCVGNGWAAEKVNMDGRSITRG